MKISIIMIAISLLLGQTSGFAQGFVNLNFNSPNLAGYTSGSLVPAANAFPGWTVNAPSTGWDGFSLESGSVNIIDTNATAYWIGFPPVQSKYAATLLTPEGQYSVSIGQTGEIPISAMSILFWGTIGDLQITFGSQPLSFQTIETVNGVSLYEANVSQFSGETGLLLFTQPPYSERSLIDDIQFSSSPVPEPGEFALAALGASLLGLRRWKSPSK